MISKKALEVNTYISNTGPSRTMHECFFFALNMNSHFPEAPPGVRRKKIAPYLHCLTCLTWVHTLSYAP